MKKNDELSKKYWAEEIDKRLTFPNGQIAQVAYLNVATCGEIVRRYNEVGELIFTNEKCYY